MDQSEYEKIIKITQRSYDIINMIFIGNIVIYIIGASGNQEV